MEELSSKEPAEESEIQSSGALQMGAIDNLCGKIRYLLHGAKGEFAEDPFLHGAITELKMIQRRLNSRKIPVLAFCGCTNVGKSTLVNALLGEKIAPVSNRDWSARPVEYRYADQESQAIFLPDRYPLKEILFSTTEELESILEQQSTMAEPETADATTPVLVRLEVPLLNAEDGQDFILCDMPGFGATTGENAEETNGIHDQAIKNYLEENQASLHIFLVARATLPNESVIRYIRDNMADYHLGIIINYRATDGIDDRKKELERSWCDVLSRPLDFRYINAKKAKEGSEEKEELLRYLKKFSMNAGKLELVAEDLARIIKETGIYLKQLKKVQDIQEVFLKTRYGVVTQLIEETPWPHLQQNFSKYWQ